MMTQPPSAMLREQLRQKIRERIERLQLERSDAAVLLGLSSAQMSRLAGNQDIFTLDRLVDAATRVGLTVRITATRPYHSS